MVRGMKKASPTAKVSRPKPFWENEDEGPPKATAEVTNERRLPTLPGLRIGAVLGEGGTATVYEAVDSTGQRCALKVARGDVDRREVQREAQAMAALTHPSIPRVHRHGVLATGEPYVLMERMDGVPLDVAFSERTAPPPWRVTRSHLLELLDVLTALHGAGLVHRDVKPSNLLVRAGEPSLVLLDFGITRELDGGAVKPTSAHAVRGTLEYMSPEQLAGRALDEKSDVFSAALVALESATGHLPWAATLSLSARLEAMQAEPVRRPATIPVADFSVLSRLLALDPRERPTAREATALLQRTPPRRR